MINFNKIVNKLGKKGGKILWKKDIFEIIDPEGKKEFQKKVDMTIYKLKAENIIISLKSGVYLVPTKEDRGQNKVDIMEKYFLELLKKYIVFYVGNQYMMSGQKALEVHMKNYAIPEKITIITRKLNKKIKVGNYEIIFKTISGKHQGKKINLFSCVYKQNVSKNIEGIDFKLISLEHALLETALMQENYAGISVDLITKAIKRYGTTFDKNRFEELGKYKYVMSFNRIKEISKTIDTNLSQLCLDIIKKNGALFIGEGLRGI